MPNKTSNNFFPPVSTGVHNNIDNLILQAELNKFAQTGVMYADKTPEYIGGTGDVVANVAMAPIVSGVKLFRGVPQWFRKQMVQGGKYKSPPNKFLESMMPENVPKGKIPFLDPVSYYGEDIHSILKGLGSWVSKSKKEALQYANLGKEGERMLLEFDVPRKIFKEKIKSVPFGKETWFEGGIPKKYLKKVHKGFQEGGAINSLLGMLLGGR